MLTFLFSFSLSEDEGDEEEESFCKETEGRIRERVRRYEGV
jgi:hypothetical protein